ncbi:MAG: hypothetical protein A2V86_01350 [Deltaproteobacteria bacterium RBG_16_49_23]|nr:MAG: hypothetical protein A2V86_01350 [Deltaproteobacteria bacterium RBG_16_49_23]
MSFKYGILCLMLSLMVFFLGIESYEVWNAPIPAINEKTVNKRPMEKRVDGAGTAGEKTTRPADSSMLVAEKNIFSPERKEFPIPSLPQAGGKNQATRPQIVLHGVILAGDYQSASIVHPGRPLKKDERETISLRVGEKVGEYKLTKVLPDRITLEAEGDSFEVLLYDPEKIKKRSEARPVAAASILPSSPTAQPPQVPGQVVRPSFPTPVTPPQMPPAVSTQTGPETSSTPSPLSQRRRRPLPGAPSSPVTPGTPAPGNPTLPNPSQGPGGN